ncbi:hypothetical protein KAR91_33560, partial [Candidatus Pacearchaeota archaeon]|nr:hypothetical protein [Candidatus Pacearchaeota archaeon]
ELDKTLYSKKDITGLFKLLTTSKFSLDVVNRGSKPARGHSDGEEKVYVFNRGVSHFLEP